MHVRALKTVGAPKGPLGPRACGKSEESWREPPYLVFDEVHGPVLYFVSNVHLDPLQSLLDLEYDADFLIGARQSNVC